MAAIQGLYGVHITVIKRFRFPEPVFFPDKLHKKNWLELLRGERDARALSDSDRINAWLNSPKPLAVAEKILLKPVRNPNTRQEFFWAPFKTRPAPVTFGLPRALPMFPFQVLFEQPRVFIAKSEIERHIGTSVKDLRVAFDAWLYPPGAGSLHLSLYVEASEGELDLSKILDMTRNLNNIPVFVRYGKRRLAFSSVFGFLHHLTDHLLDQLLKGRHGGREIGGYYVVYNLEGQVPDWKTHVDALGRLLGRYRGLEVRKLRRLSAKVRNSIGAGRSEDDLIAIGERASIISVDGGIWKKYDDPSMKGLAESRRCFRNHFLSAVEMAFVCESLVTEYATMFGQILAELEAAPLGTSIWPIIKKAITFGALKPIAYVTVRDSVLTVHDRLERSRGDGFWKDVYLTAAREMRLLPRLKMLAETTDKLFAESVEYKDRRYEQLNSICRGLRDTTIKVLEAIKPGIGT